MGVLIVPLGNRTSDSPVPNGVNAPLIADAAGVVMRTASVGVSAGEDVTVEENDGAVGEPAGLPAHALRDRTAPTMLAATAARMPTLGPMTRTVGLIGGSLATASPN